MTQTFMADGKVVPVTRIQAGPCYVTQKKADNSADSKAIQIAWSAVKSGKLNNALKGFFKKIFNQEIGYKHLKEFRLNTKDAMFDKLPIGQKIDVSMFKVGELTDVQGTSRGLGFQGVVKGTVFMVIRPRTVIRISCACPVRSAPRVRRTFSKVPEWAATWAMKM